MKRNRMGLFIFTLILLLAITAYSIYQEQKNPQEQQSYFSYPTPIYNPPAIINI